MKLSVNLETHETKKLEVSSFKELPEVALNFFKNML